MQTSFEFHSAQRENVTFLPPALDSFCTGGGGGGGAKRRDIMCNMCKLVLDSDWLLRRVAAAPESPGYKRKYGGCFGK